MIQVTLLRRPHQTFTFQVGSQTYRFIGSQTVETTREIAEACLQKFEDDKPLFEVIGLSGDPDADVSQVLGIQMDFAEWPSSQQ
ncbi:MAG: hypothetical protein HY913_04405 [Desulfomonile tiedjei]|nr:hypothetical protein [Desulfomonile tiedjei]